VRRTPAASPPPITGPVVAPVTERQLRRVAPFALGAAMPFLVLLVPPNTHRVTETLLAGALTIVIAALTWVGVRRDASPGWFSALALAYLLVVVLIRDSEGGGQSGYGPLVLLPLLWISMYGNRRDLIACVVGIWLAYSVPIWVVGGDAYPADVEGRRAAVWVVTSLMIGFSVQELVGRLRASEGRYRSIFEHAREVIFQLDAEGRWRVLNPAWQTVTGYPIEQSIGTPFIEYVHPEDRAANEALFEQLRRRELPGYSHEMRYRTANGSYRWLEVWARPVLDHDRLLGVTGTLVDITERYEAEQMKEQFFALVSHELRTPLAAIIGYLELLGEEEGERLSEDGRNFVAVMQRNSQRLMRLIGDLLFAAQVESGTLSLQRAPVNLAQVVRDACESAQPRAEQRDLDLSLEVGVDPAPIIGDRERLGQVLDNLLTNAIKFTPAGGDIRLTLSRDGHDEEHGGDAYAIEVTDTGPGIPDDEQERLFDRFRRARSADEQAVQGVGLGLAITRAIVQGHGGRIGLHSIVGTGTTFRVELPTETRKAVDEAGQEGAQAHG
jgi:PAS domain S-box-containing protein